MSISHKSKNLKKQRAQMKETRLNLDFCCSHQNTVQRRNDWLVAQGFLYTNINSKCQKVLIFQTRFYICIYHFLWLSLRFCGVHNPSLNPTKIPFKAGQFTYWPSIPLVEHMQVQLPNLYFNHVFQVSNQIWHKNGKFFNDIYFRLVQPMCMCMCSVE